MSQVKANPTAAAEAEEPVRIPYDEYCAITYATAGLQRKQLYCKCSLIMSDAVTSAPNQTHRLRSA